MPTRQTTRFPFVHIVDLIKSKPRKAALICLDPELQPTDKPRHEFMLTVEQAVCAGTPERRFRIVTNGHELTAALHHLYSRVIDVLLITANGLNDDACTAIRTAVGRMQVRWTHPNTMQPRLYFVGTPPDSIRDICVVIPASEAISIERPSRSNRKRSTATGPIAEMPRI